MDELFIEKREGVLIRHPSGWKILFFSAVSSTSSILHQWAKKGEEEGLVVVAKRQHQGRGRQGRSWLSLPGGLYMSLLLRPTTAFHSVGRIPFLFALVLIQLLRESYSLPAVMKWPNDVQIKGKKLAGILTEMSVDKHGRSYLVTGIGININQREESWPHDLKGQTTSLAQELQVDLNSNDLLFFFLQRLEKAYRMFLQGSLDPVAAHLQYSATLGQRVHIKNGTGDYYGQAVEITPTGSLRVDCGGGIIREFFTGEVTARKMDSF